MLRNWLGLAYENFVSGRGNALKIRVAEGSGRLGTDHLN